MYRGEEVIYAEIDRILKIAYGDFYGVAVYAIDTDYGAQWAMDICDPDSEHHNSFASLGPRPGFVMDPIVARSLYSLDTIHLVE